MVGLPKHKTKEKKAVAKRGLKPTDKIFWSRALMGIFAGLLAGLLGFITPNINAYRGILIAVAFYALTYYLSRYVLAKDLPKEQSHKYVTLGIGSFIMLFLFTWILYNTFINFSFG